MAEREDLELERRTAPKGGQKCGQKGAQEVPEGSRRKKDHSQFINQIGFARTTLISALNRALHIETQLREAWLAHPAASRGATEKSTPWKFSNAWTCPLTSTSCVSTRSN